MTADARDNRVRATRVRKYRECAALVRWRAQAASDAQVE